MCGAQHYERGESLGITDEREELNRLCKEVRKLRMEREILIKRLLRERNEVKYGLIAKQAGNYPVVCCAE